MGGGAPAIMRLREDDGAAGREVGEDGDGDRARAALPFSLTHLAAHRREEKIERWGSGKRRR